MEKLYKDYPPAFRLTNNQVIIVCHECNAVIDPKTATEICAWCGTELLAEDIK